MFFSLIQTVVCVLLINGGLYALHLTSSSSGGSGGGSTSSVGAGSSSSALGGGSGKKTSQQQLLQEASKMNSMLSAFSGGGLQQQQQQQQQQHSQHFGMQHNGRGGRLNEDLADLAQLERERLMVLGVAKQAVADGTGHHGRPIITGRIQMTPAEEVESDYSPLLLQQTRGYMFGNVVKQPTASDDEYEDGAQSTEKYEDNDGIGGSFPARRRPIKYDYGRIVQPSEQQRQREPHDQHDPQNLDLDAYMELEAEPEVEDMLPDLDGYQYLDELMAEQQQLQHRGWGEQPAPYGGHHGLRLQNPYQSGGVEHYDAAASYPASHALQELFHEEQQDEAAQQQYQHAVASAHHALLKPPPPPGNYNIRLHQKWQRKRAQQQQQRQPSVQQQHKDAPELQRKFFIDHQQQQQHYKPQHAKLATAHSEATATNHLSSSNNNNNNKSPASLRASDHTNHADAATVVAALKSSSTASSSSSDRSAEQKTASSGSGSSSASAAATPKETQQQQESSATTGGLLSSNHKRSSTAAGGMGYSGVQPLATHSIASQLMLRTARGQRQYDVPQIECPTAMDGMERFACPTPDLQGRYRCIDDHVLCDGFIDCPEGEDEDRRSCMFYKTTKAHLDVLADALLRWARGR